MNGGRAAELLFAETDRATKREMTKAGDDHAQARLVASAVIVRFWSRVDKDAPGGCWEWTGKRTLQGYGISPKILGTAFAHRVAWLLTRGPIPDGFHVDHLCRNRCCVNPDHLEPVYPLENTRRSRAWLEAGRKNAAKTHCPSGHPYDEHNTLILARGRRDCRACNAAGAGKRKTNRSRTHCPQGHEYTPENTFLDSGKWRRCLACRRQRDRDRSRAGDTHGLVPVSDLGAGRLPPDRPVPSNTQK